MFLVIFSVNLGSKSIMSTLRFSTTNSCDCQGGDRQEEDGRRPERDEEGASGAQPDLVAEDGGLAQPAAAAHPP
ncbi:MAG: hypothetical protein QOI56_475, partial [Actinomycetota bacterium]|nr:hypothetical protein [Actinomycetota bacterium]